MPIPIRLDEEHDIHAVLGEWGEHIERAAREHFPSLSVSRAEHHHEEVLFLLEKGRERGEIVLRWDPAAPHEISIFPQPALVVQAAQAKAGSLARRVAAACLIAASALWLGAAIGFWKDFLAIASLQGKLVVVAIGVVAWLASSLGLAALAYYLVRRSHHAIDAPRAERDREWLDHELWPWLLGALEELTQRARQDTALAHRLAADF